MNVLSPTHRARAVAALFCCSIAACATNPVTGKKEFSLVSESQEIQMGQQAAEEAKASIGVTPDQALQSYVSGLGMTIAKHSERPNLPWQFTVVEDASVNAFALPGGPVFVTRGILAHMNSEAQLMSVLGHEIGHITAKHSVSQISKQQIAQIGVIGAVLVKPELGQLADVASTGLGLLFLKFGRDDEAQADELGFRYMTQAGYNAREMAEMFRILERLSSGQEGKTPQWLSTHPDPGNRVQATLTRIQQNPASGNGRVERDAFLQRLEGLTFGEDPRQGFFRGTSFLHPDMRFQIDFPNGWKTQNSTAQVVAVSSQQDAIVALTLAQGSPSQALNTFVGQQGMQSRNASSSSINGFPAASAQFSATLQDNSSVTGWVAFVNIDNTTIRLLAYTPTDRFSSYDNTLRQSIASFRRLTDQSALNVQPSKVHLVRLGSAMTISQFNQQYPSSIDLNQLALINGVQTNTVIPAGTMVKRVAAGR